MVESSHVGVDARLTAIEQRLDFVVTKDDLEAAFEKRFATLVMREDFDSRITTLVTRDEFDRRIATLVTREEWKAGRVEDRDEMRNHFLMLAEDFRAQVKIIAEGHAVLLAGQERIIERIDKLEVDLTSLIMTAYRDLDRRKQDKRSARRPGR
jgi:hypothetical protein